MKRQHKRNLIRLGKYLHSLPVDCEHFNMEDYFYGDPDKIIHYLDDNNVSRDSVLEIYGEYPSSDIIKSTLSDPIIAKHCGTVGCALGHAPLLGYGLKPEYGETWDDYCLRVFGFSAQIMINGHYRENDYWEWAFGSGWSGQSSYHTCTVHLQDNTPQGAGMRLLWLAFQGYTLPGFLQKFLDNHPDLDLYDTFKQLGWTEQPRKGIELLQPQYDKWKAKWCKQMKSEGVL